MDLALEAPAQGAATLGLALRDAPTHPCPAQGQTLCESAWGFHASAALAIPYTEPQRDAAIATHAETAQPVLKIIPAILARPVGWPRGPWCLRGLYRGPIEGNRGGILRQPRRWEGVDLQRFEREGPKDLGEMGGKPRIADVPSPVIVE
jgi:hypothetical protein